MASTAMTIQIRLPEPPACWNRFRPASDYCCEACAAYRAYLTIPTLATALEQLATSVGALSEVLQAPCRGHFKN